MAVFDGRKNVYTARKLPGIGTDSAKEYEIKLKEAKDERERSFTVSFQRV